MPRTKISKTKRNRDAAKEEREEIKNELLREFDSSSEQMEQKLLTFYDQRIADILAVQQNLKLKLPKKALNLPFIDFINLNEFAINEFNKTDSINSSKFVNGSVLAPVIPTISNSSCGSKKSKDDEGYLTEDSSSLRNSNQLQLPTFPTSVGRTPGPLSSALAKGRVRRSKSATGLLNSAQKVKPFNSVITNDQRISRSKLKTPLIQQKNSSRQKAFSADRAALVTPICNGGESPIVYRWPKPGEKIISMSGSPIVSLSSMVPDSIANINIPTKNGMLSLRPKHIDANELERKIGDRLCPETMAQIKQLHASLNMIMNLADK